MRGHFFYVVLIRPVPEITDMVRLDQIQPDIR